MDSRVINEKGFISVIWGVSIHAARERRNIPP
jgi:hypothetical protein